MKEFMRWAALTIAGVAFTCPVRAQFTQQPQCGIHLQFIDSHGGQPSITLEFGFDPTATDSLDQQFGEADFPPPTSIGSGIYEAFQLPDTMVGTGEPIFSGIDIRPRPNRDTFSINYAFYASASHYPGHLSWNRDEIPQAVTAIRVFGQDGSYIADLTQQDSISVPLSQYQQWDPATIILYYNVQPPSLDVSPIASTDALIQSAMVYPNPCMSNSSLSITLSEPCLVRLAAYDATGRVCFERSQLSSIGTSELDLTGLAGVQGAMLLCVEARTPAKTERKTLMLMKQE